MNIVTRSKATLIAATLCLVFLYSPLGLAVDMPVGIPAPAFGLDEVAPSAPAAWPGSEATGYYYIDNTDPNATDSSNPYGYPNKPRATIPNYTSFPAGTYMEVHGGPYSGNQLVMTFNCTAQNPCWFRGADENNKPIIRYETIAKGSYVIFEYLKFDTDGKGVGFRSHDTSSLNHAVLRHSEITGSGTATSQNHAAVSIMGNSSNRFTDIVVYDNQIHDLGDHSPSVPENDYHGIHPDIYADRVWILNNHVYHMGGDSIQIGRAQTALESYSSHIYVGGNDFHENHEDTIDIKKVNDVIISENKLHDLPELGAIVVVHDNPDNIWIINNHMYNATVGVASVSASNVWVLNNLITDINHNPAESFDPNSSYQHGAGVHFRGTTTGGIINNTIVRCDFGIELAGGPGPYSVVGNIIAYRAESSAWDIISPSSTVTSVTEFNYNIFTSAKLNWADGTNSSLAYVQSAYNKCGTCWSGTEHPGFLNNQNNFDIGANSTARDAGIEHGSYNTFFTRYGDHIYYALDGSNRRTTGTAFDIGAYEYNDGSVSKAAPNPPSTLTGSTNP